MKKGIKKIIAMVCAIAMVVSSMTVRDTQQVQAVDWTTATTWKTLTADGQDYYVSKDGNWLNENYQVFATGWLSTTALWINFASAEVTKVVVNGTEYIVNEHKVQSSTVRFEGAQMWLSVDLCDKQQTTVEFYNNSTLQGTWYIYNPNGSSGDVTTVSPVTNLNVEPGENMLTVTWNRPVDATVGTKYYVYLDDEQEARVVVTDTTKALVTGVSVGEHTVKVKAFYNDTFSEPTVSSPQNVVENTAEIYFRDVVSVKAKKISVLWEIGAEYDTKCILNVLDMNGEIVTSIQAEYLRMYVELETLKKGTYVVQVLANDMDGTERSAMSKPVYVGEYDPVKPTRVECTQVGATKVHVSWEVQNPPEEQYYKVYLDHEFLTDVPVGTLEYDIQNISLGEHVIEIYAASEIYTTEDAAGTFFEVVKERVYDTEVDLVTTGGIQQLESPWSYEFDAGSSDSLVGVSADGDFVARIPTYAEKAVNHVYEQITGLEVGKIYTYTYRVDTTVADNNLPVTVTAEGGYSDTYTLEQIPAEGVEVTKTFTATAETMKIDYTLGWLNNSPDIKISKAVVTMEQPVEVRILNATGGTKSIELVWSALATPKNQKYNIYLDGSTTPIATDVTTKSYTLSDVPAGTHSVTVKAVYNGIETTGKTVENIVVTDTPTCLTSSEVMVEGFQIKTNAPEDNVGFRTICKAPNPGSDIFVSDGFYKVKSVGVIYTLDVNNNGYRKNDILDSSYTILNPTAVSADITETKGYTYVGETLYDGAQRTYGYVATEDGIASNWNPTDDMNTYYIRTMDGMSEHGILEYSIHVRAFVIATDGTIIYGTSTASVSVAEVADYLYRNSKAQNYTGHQYLYNSILNKLTNTNPYYRTSPLSYGWDSSLFDPTPPEETTTTIQQVLG